MAHSVASVILDSFPGEESQFSNTVIQSDPYDFKEVEEAADYVVNLLLAKTMEARAYK